MSEDVGRRTYLGVTRGTVVQADDSKKMQELTVRDRFGEKWSNVEHWTPYGHTHVPLPPETDRQAEVVVAYLGGSPDHPVVLATADRRHRPKNLKPGESARFDDQRQITKIGRDGISTTGKKVEITGGGDTPKGDTKDHELNEQLKGIAARLAQTENLVAAQHHVTSKLRENVESVLPTLIPVNAATQVTAILNKLPGGLDAMAQDVAGKAQAYLQKQVEQSLAKFLSPNLAELQSLLSGGLEGLIGGLKGQVASLIAANPIVGIIDDLKDEMAAVSSSGGAAGIVATKVAELQGKIDALTSANPIVSQVATIRSNLEGLIAQAGPALNFLEPQKRLVQGQTRSVRFGG